MKKTLLQAVKFLGFLSIALLLLYYAFKGVKWENVMDGLRETNYWWVVLSLLISILAFLSRARRWDLIIEPLGFRPSFLSTFYALMIGYLANFAFPRIGEVTRCVSLGKKEKIPVDSLIGTVIVERAIDVLMLALIMFGLLLARWKLYSNFFRDEVFVPLGNKIAETFGGGWIFWSGVVIVLAALTITLYLLRKKLYRFKLVLKIKDTVKGILEGLKTIFRMQRKWEFLFHTLFIWLAYIFMTWVVVFALPATAGLRFADGVFLLVIGGLGMSAPAQGGFGAYHLITSLGLFSVYGLAKDQGLVYAVLCHESQLLLIILFGVFSLRMILKKKTQNNGSLV